MIRLYLCFVLSLSIFAGELDTPIEVALSNPDKPAKLSLSIHRGSITVESHDQKTMIVKSISHAPEQDANDKPLPKGLRKVGELVPGFTINEDRNHVTVVNGGKPSAETHFHILAPRATTLNLKVTTIGEVTVKNIHGEIEVQSSSGAVSLINVSGPVTAHTVRMPLKVFLAPDYSKQPLSLTTMYGDIEVYFPGDAKASFRLNKGRGDLFTDLDMSFQQEVRKTRRKPKNKGYETELGSIVIGHLNGGGAQVHLKNNYGDIILRKLEP